MWFLRIEPRNTQIQLCVLRLVSKSTRMRLSIHHVVTPLCNLCKKKSLVAAQTFAFMVLLSARLAANNAKLPTSHTNPIASQHNTNQNTPTHARALAPVLVLMRPTADMSETRGLSETLSRVYPSSPAQVEKSRCSFRPSQAPRTASSSAFRHLVVAFFSLSVALGRLASAVANGPRC